MKSSLYQSGNYWGKLFFSSFSTITFNKFFKTPLFLTRFFDKSMSVFVIFFSAVTNKCKAELNAN
ncbi:MAG: hypothetical protein BAA00_20615 [Parageobacillus thermoglucosidasius]|nr:MAG: hypothetical protein BAA00_20615 [Parageobacillus thermoglucosidasius]